MNLSRFSPDDPKLTAYALGELPEADRAAVEAALRDDPAARAAVEQVRQLSQALEAALANEPEPASHAPILAGSHAELAQPPVNGHAPEPARTPRVAHPGRGLGTNILSFPQLYYVVGGLAAACFAVAIALRDDPSVRERRSYSEVRFTPSSSTTQALPGGDTAALPAATDGLNSQAGEPRIEPFAAAKEQFAETARANLREVAVGGLLDQARTSHAASAGGVVDFAGTTDPVTIAAAQAESLKSRVASTVPSPAPVDEAKRFSLAGGPQSRRMDKVSYGALAARGVTLGAAAPGSNQRGGASTMTMRSERTARGYARAVPPGTAPGTAALAILNGKPLQEHFAFRLPGEWKHAIETMRGFTADDPVPAWRVPLRSERSTESLYVHRPSPVRYNTESYAYLNDNPFTSAAVEPFSTFSVDVDTASYANVRRFIEGGQLPPPDAVRIEELLNYFTYGYAAPAAGSDVPVLTSLEVADAPWAAGHRLVRIGIKAREVSAAERPAANLVFLLDVSGSMRAENKLPLVKQALRVLTEALRPDDRVAIVTYAGSSGLALPSTAAAKSRVILDAIDALSAGGGTNGGMGIQLAYDVAKANFIAGGINRVVLCTDGDFNIGTTSQGELARLIEEKTKSGVALTALGFGMHNYKDSTLELLADKGNGNYGYIDTRREAEKLLAKEINGTLHTVAKDVKVQVDFNPARVASYRLIGYEDRMLKKQDFNNDAVDAGEMGAGHAVTALYEIVPVGVATTVKPPIVDISRYAAAPLALTETPRAAELLAVKIRYKTLDGEVSRKLEIPLTDAGARFEDASPDFRFAAAVAAYGMVLRESPHRGTATIGDVIAWAASAAAKPGDDPVGQRGEFIDLARRTKALMQ